MTAGRGAGGQVPPRPHLPDKAIDVLDEAGAIAHGCSVPSRTPGSVKSPSTIGEAEVEPWSPGWRRSPQDRRRKREGPAPGLSRRTFVTVIFGQDEAIRQVVSRDQALALRPRESDKPIGSFLFSGPTGVGKTELAKQLAKSSGSSSSAST
jgi:ATP-dependent Clp protease ATP-binding subunit ClpA